MIKKLTPLLLRITRVLDPLRFRRKSKETASQDQEVVSIAPETAVRWPAVYDSTELAEAIKQLITPNANSQVLIYREDDSLPAVCQGDVVAFKSAIPIIGPTGNPEKIDKPVSLWLVVGNTCDFERSAVTNLSICPILDFEKVQGVNLDSVRRFETSRLFHVRPWDDNTPNTLCADLNFMVSVDKRALINIAKRQTRLSSHGWLLLHCCLVRFLARDDGRHD